MSYAKSLLPLGIMVSLLGTGCASTRAVVAPCPILPELPPELSERPKSPALLRELDALMTESQTLMDELSRLVQERPDS